MEDMVESANETARDCEKLSERLRLSAAKLEAIIPRVNGQWHGVAGEEFTVGLWQIFEKFESVEQRLLVLAERIEQTANDLSAEF